jgi:hypothetical protein
MIQGGWSEILCSAKQGIFAKEQGFERKNREFEPGIVQSDFRMTFSKGIG